MAFLLFYLPIVLACSDFCNDEIAGLQKELRTLTRARSLLQKGGSDEMFTLLPYTDQTWSLYKFIEKSAVLNNGPITSVGFISLKPMAGLLHPSNIGVLIGYSSGLLELREITGDLLYKVDLGYSVKAFAATNSFDEIRFACISPKSTIEIFSITIEKLVRSISIETQGLQTTKVFISISKEIEIEISDQPQSILFYIRGGKKFWVVGSQKYLTIIGFAGNKESETLLGIGPIVSLDRFGPQLIVASESTVGVMNLSTLELNQKCSMGGRFVALDTANLTSVVYAVTDKGVAMMDTRVVQNESFICKDLGKIQIDTEKVISTKEYLIGWKGGIASFLNSSNYGLVNTLQVTQDVTGENLMASVRIANGGYFIALGQGTELHIFELSTSGKSQPSSDFANLKYIL